MKKLINQTALILLGTAILLNCSCKSSPEVSAYKSTGVVVVTVDSAMKAWGDYVRAGLASVDSQLKVKATYDKYYLTVQAAKAVITVAKSNNSTNQVVNTVAIISSAGAEVIGLVESFLPPDRLIKLQTQGLK